MMKQSSRFATVFVLLVSATAFTGCKSASRDPASPRSTKQAGVAHVVLFWLKQPGDEASIRKIIETSESFRSIPGVIDLTVGRPLPSTRPVVDSSYDVGLVMTFADEQALHAYETHPKHAAAVKQTLRPLAAKIQVYDVKR